MNGEPYQPFAASCSRHFRVKDPEALIEDLNDVEINVEVDDDPENPKGSMVYLYTDSGTWPEHRVNLEDGGPGDELDLFKTIAGHLQDGEVAVFETISSEGPDDVEASAFAINSAGETREFTLDDFADRAVEELGGNRANL